MRKNVVLWLVPLLSLFVVGALFSQRDRDPAGKKRDKRGPRPDYSEEAEVYGEAIPVVTRRNKRSEKVDLDAYLRGRRLRIQRVHKARMDFMDREFEAWTKIWGKVREDRSRFEVRIARQRTDISESLSSLDSRDRQTALADFEKLQAGVINAFETQQKQKMQNFFSQKEARWKEFVLEQEKERAAFLEDAQASWKIQKEALKSMRLDRSRPSDREDRVFSSDEDAGSSDDGAGDSGKDEDRAEEKPARRRGGR